MAKKIDKRLKIMAPGGTATPAPPIGPALGAAGVNPGQFVQQFNERTKRPQRSSVVGCRDHRVSRIGPSISRSSRLPAAVLICEAAGVEKGSGDAKHGQGRPDHTRAGLNRSPRSKMTDLNAERRSRRPAGADRRHRPLDGYYGRGGLIDDDSDQTSTARTIEMATRSTTALSPWPTPSRLIKSFKGPKFDQSVEIVRCTSVSIPARRISSSAVRSRCPTASAEVRPGHRASAQEDKVDDAKAAGAVEAGGRGPRSRRSRAAGSSSMSPWRHPT